MSEENFEQRRPRIPDHDDEWKTAEILGKSRRTLRHWRRLGIGPPWVQYGNSFVYPIAEREKWLRSHLVNPPREGVPA